MDTMNIQKLLLSILLYGFIGWFLDSAVRFIRYGAWINGTYLEIPWSPMYALGALIILFVFRFIKERHILIQFAVYAVVVPLYEYLGGIVSIWIAGRRLWDYTDLPFDIGGHTTALHTVAWAALAIMLVHFIHPSVVSLLERVNKATTSSPKAL